MKLGIFYILPTDPISATYFTNPSRHSACMYSPILTRQKLGTNVTMVRLVSKVSSQIRFPRTSAEPAVSVSNCGFIHPEDVGNRLWYLMLSCIASQLERLLFRFQYVFPFKICICFSLYCDRIYDISTKNCEQAALQLAPELVFRRKVPDGSFESVT
jgi:hypothetical protein